MAVITMGGQFGAGALEIGDATARTLKIDYIERVAVSMVAKRLNATFEAVWQKENHLCSWLERLSTSVERVLTYSGTYGAFDRASGFSPHAYDSNFAFPGDPNTVRQRPHEIPDGEYRRAMAAINADLANDGDLVLTLRGGSATLRDREDTLHVGLFAPMDHRITRVANRRGWGTADAADFIRARQDRRTELFQRTIGTDQSDPALYDIMVNTAKIDDLRAVNEIAEGASGFGPMVRPPLMLDPSGASEIQHLNMN